MKRDLAALARGRFDVLVAGGGIYGASIAREAARRGLATALVEKEDFGHATSWNSMKILHGGLRYLQHLDLRRTRESMREQATWLRLAPGLVRPTPFVMPTYAGSLRGRAAMRLGLAVEAGLRRLGGAALPAGRILDPDECLGLAPHVATRGLTGAALWHEAVASSSERLLLAVVRSAANAGAEVANYAEVTALSGETGVNVRDTLTGERFEVEARLVVDARGPGCERPLDDGAPALPALDWARAMNLVTRPLNPGCALGVSSRRGRGRLWFVVPWRDVSLVGTAYFPVKGEAEAPGFTDEEIEGVVREVAAALPGSDLRAADVRLAHGGFVPVDGWRADGEAVLASRPRIEERGRVVRVVGIKYTTARAVAAAVVDRIGSRSGGASPVRAAGAADAVPLLEAPEPGLDASGAGIAAETLRRLGEHHGAAASRLVDLARQDRRGGEPLAPGCEVIGAEVVHAVRAEMAQRLTDVVFRRTPLGSAGDPGETAISAAAAIAARELGWSAGRTTDEIAAVRAFLSLHRALPTVGGERSAATS